MNRLRRRGVDALLVGALGLGLGSCDHVSGPSLSAEVVEQALAPTASAELGSTSICCCRVTGRVRNTSTIPVHVSLRWTAKTKDGGVVGTAADFVYDIPPSQTKPFDAAGIFEACERVASLEPSQFVIGAFKP